MLKGGCSILTLTQDIGEKVEDDHFCDVVGYFGDLPSDVSDNFFPRGLLIY